MRLYYMTNLETAEKHILPEWRMKLSTFDKVNDPFELLCADQGDQTQKHILKILREHWTRRLGFICFSANWESPLMWAHYAESHKGVCLGFDILEEEKIQKMVYEPDRLKGLFDVAKPNAGANEETLLKVLTTKFKQWEYENEWRVFANLDDRDAKTGLYYVDFGPNVVLREIIVGARCSKPVGDFAKLVKASGKVIKPVTVIKARPAFQTFTMTPQKGVKALTVKPSR
jgi:hypothetical protein